MNRFVLENNFIKDKSIYIYHLLINIFIKVRGQSYASKTVGVFSSRNFLSSADPKIFLHYSNFERLTTN